MTGTNVEKANRRHPQFWLEDGSLIIRSQRVLYKIHKTLLFRQSSTLQRWADEVHVDLSDIDQNLYSRAAGFATLTIPDDVGLRNDDLEALLQHLYHDVPLSPQASFSHVASVIRASSSKQLNFPAIHRLACEYIENMFPSGPEPFSHPGCLEEAWTLATEYDIPIQKGLLYSIVTTLNFDAEGGDVAPRASSLIPVTDSETVPPISFSDSALSPTDVQRCRCLMKDIMEHFTPILFTPATTPHMACTDVFADTWMSFVIQPALANGGVYKPLETLQDIIDVNWSKHGLCTSCVIEKRAEWYREQQNVWAKMDQWTSV